MSSSSSTSTATKVVVAAVAVAAVAAAGYYLLAPAETTTSSSGSSSGGTSSSSASSSATPSAKGSSPTKSKKKKKKKSKKQSASTAASSDKAAKPAAAAAAGSPAPASTSTATTSSADKASAGASSASAAAAPTSASDAIFGIERNADGLQIKGKVPESAILDFFKRSNALLEKQSTKDDLAAAHKRGESISEVLKGKQESVWAELGVEAQFGFQTIQNTLNDPSSMTDSLKGALLQAAAAEDSILTYALLGSQEKFEAEQARLKRLTEQAQIEVQTEIAPLYQRQDQSALQAYYAKVKDEFVAATKDFEGQDELGRLKMRQKLTDEQYKAIVKGQMLEQIKAYQQQQMMMAQMQAMQGGR